MLGRRGELKTQQAIEEFMLSRSGLSPKTRRGYRQHLAEFQAGFATLPDTPQPVQGWLARFTGAPETIHARFRTVRAFYKQICLWHPKVKNPMSLVRAPQLRPKVMRTFSDEELYRMFTLPLSPRDRALSTLLLDVGPRADECANLTWDNVIPCYVVLNGKTGERVVPISDTTYRLLEAIGRKGPHQHVFQGKRGPLRYMGIYKMVGRLCHQAGICGRRTSPQTFRHTFGTNYAAADGCDSKVLQDIMGHHDFKTTLRYIHNNPKRMSDNHRRCTPLKVLATAAQGMFIAREITPSDAVRQAEEIVAGREEKGG